MFGIGPMELVVIVVVALLIFGPQRLPEFARTLGKGLAEFRRASNELRQTLALDELQNDLRKTINQPGNPAPPRPAQAGDTLPAGAAAGANVPATDVALTSTPPSTPPSPNTSASSAATPEAASPSTAGTTADAAPAPPRKSHPGELPLDRDHEHNDPTPDPTESPRLAAADPGLGNVPVTGADPTGTRRG